MKVKAVSIAVVVLAVFVAAASCTDEDELPTTECTTGAGCFPDGQLPLEVTSKDTAYYCCLQRNRTEKSSRLPDGTFNCSCVLDLSLPDKIVNWARNTRDQGRMCLHERCKGVGVTITTSERFHHCCPDNGSNNTRSEVTWFDADKEEFIGCRCIHLPVPSPDPRAYVVPPVVASYNSTGETCAFDAACQDQPSLVCESRWTNDVTFCCYGSRGMVTQNEGDSLTRCTCTDDVYAAHCEDRPIAIADTSLPCQTECANRTEQDRCSDSQGAMRCCPHNMAVVASQSAGSFTSCTCKAQAAKVNSCGTSEGSGDVTTTTTPSSSARRLSFGVRLSDVVLLVLVVMGFCSYGGW